MTTAPIAVELERIPFVDLQAEYRALAANGLENALLNTLRKTQYIQSSAVQSFERKWAGYCGSAHAVATDSGTAALVVTLKALGIGLGDEVIVPAHTFIATAAAVTLCGAKPVFVDADPVHWQLNPALLPRAVTMNTRAVIAVHLFGHTVDVPAIETFCEERGLFLIEDAAQAHGARFYGERVGSFGKAGCFSFYPAKNLGAFGDGGAVTTNDEELAWHIRRLCNHGRSSKYQHEEVGENLRMDEVQGTVLDFKLAYLDEWNHHRRRLAAVYRGELERLPIFIPEPIEDTESVYHLFPIALSRRNELALHLAEEQIETGIHYPLPLHLQPAFADLGYRQGAMPVAEWIGSQELSLPIGPFMDIDQVYRVCESIRHFFRYR